MNIRVICREYMILETLLLNKKPIADENSCADCWDKQIMKMIYEEEEESELVKL